MKISSLLFIVTSIMICSLQNQRREVKGVLVNDTIRIIYDLSNSIRNNYIRGDIWLHADSLFLNYRWDRSDTWSGVPPERGTVTGSGGLKR